MYREPVRKLKRPTAEDFGITLDGSQESFFGESIVLLRANAHMLRHTLGAGTPHRMQDVRLCFHEAGETDCSVNLIRRQLRQGVLEFYGSGTIFQMHGVSNDIRLVELLVSSDIISEVMFGNVPPLYHRKATSVQATLTAAQQGCYMEMLRLLLRLLKQEGEDSPAVHGIIYSILHYAFGIFSSQEEQVEGKHSRQSQVFRDFSYLLTQSDGRQRKLSYYARQLNVTEHYLSMAVKQMSGCTPKQMLDQVVVAEVKVLLRYTDLTVQQIAYRMDIPSESFLCRFFRRMTGLTPLEYRNKRTM